MTVASELRTHRAARFARDGIGPHGLTGRLATWFAPTTLDDAPIPFREHAKYLLPDGIAGALVTGFTEFSVEPRHAAPGA